MKKGQKNKKNGKNPNGRPSKYKDIDLELVKRLAMLGLTDKEIAKSLNIAESTLNLYKKKHKRFSESLKNGKEIADAKVAESLYKRACGYEHPEEKIFCSEGEIVRANTIKHYPPDTAAAFIWLKNRQPEKWRDKREVEDTTPPKPKTIIIEREKKED